MTDESRARQVTGSQQDDRIDARERLITRLVDGQASDADRAAFEKLAAEDPTAWRTLAERQLDMAALSNAVEEKLQRATQVELPRQDVRRLEAHRASSGGRSMWHWTGWATAALLLLWVGVLSFSPTDPAAERTSPIPAHAERGANEFSAANDPHGLLLLYLDAPYVVGELDPILLQAVELDDGRIELRFIRRIEETLHFDAEESLPLDDQGRLKLDPERLRQGGSRGG